MISPFYISYFCKLQPDSLKKILLLCLFITFRAGAQDNRVLDLLKNSDTLNPKRLITVSALQGGIWAGSLIALNQAWYANYPRSDFHLFKIGRAHV